MALEVQGSDTQGNDAILLDIGLLGMLILCTFLLLIWLGVIALRNRKKSPVTLHEHAKKYALSTGSPI